MKKLIFLLGFLCTMYGLTGQTWPSIIGEPGVWEEGRQIIEHYDKGYLITSSKTNGENLQGWLVKTDVNGQVLWDKDLGFGDDKVLIDKTLYDQNGNIYIFGLLLQNQSLHEWPLIVKLNSCGELEWCKKVVHPEYQYGYFTDAILLDNGDLVGLAYIDRSPQYDIIFLICFSQDGEFKWRKVYASNDNYPNFALRMGNSIDKFGDTYVISGYVYSPYPNGNPNHVFLRPMFIGIDEEFQEKWVVEFGIADSLLGKADGAIAINDTLFMGIGRHRWGNDQEAWLMFFDKNGNQVDYKFIEDEQFGPEYNSSVLFDIERINDTLFMGTGWVGEGFGWDFNPVTEMVFDTAGNLYNFAHREYAGGGGTYLYKTFDGKYIIANSYRLSSAYEWDVNLYKINENLEMDTLYPGNYTYDSLCPHAIQSGVIDLTGCDVVTGIGEIPTLDEYHQQMQTIPIHASPNPSATGEILLEMENTARHPNLQIKVFDVFGKVIYTQAILPAQGALRLDTSGWNAGMYVAAVYSNEKIMGRCKLMIIDN